MRRSWSSTLIALYAASFLALLEVHRTMLTRVMLGEPLGFFDVWHRILPLWAVLVIISPWCAFMSHRFPLRSGRTLRTIAAHLGGAAVFVALHLAIIILYHQLVTHDLEVPGGFRLVHMYVFYIGLDLSVYAGIVVVLLLLDARREAAEQAVAQARLAEHLAGARLEALQAQIRPHFLFNTLNALAVLARKGDGAAVDRAIGDLGELLRASFDAPGRHEIPLREELEFLERYVSLQRIRFPQRLEVEWQIPEDTRAGLVPALVVQPLVENALEHGLASSRGGKVRVSARRDGDMLEIEVSDDGPGFPSTEGVAGNGVGLANTRERLALLYGARGTLTCGARTGGGGEVRIRLPWRPAGAAGAPA